MGLIDADKLKYKFEINFSKKPEAQAIYQHLIDIVDDCPTVEIPCNQIIWEQGYECGKNERSKGKWIIDGHHYKCSRCGKTLAIMFSETDDDDLIGCPFCLSEMKGGTE